MQHNFFIIIFQVFDLTASVKSKESELSTLNGTVADLKSQVDILKAAAATRTKEPASSAVDLTRPEVESHVQSRVAEAVAEHTKKMEGIIQGLKSEIEALKASNNTGGGPDIKQIVSDFYDRIREYFPQESEEVISFYVFTYHLLYIIYIFIFTQPTTNAEVLKVVRGVLKQIASGQASNKN